MRRACRGRGYFGGQRGRFGRGANIIIHERRETMDAMELARRYEKLVPQQRAGTADPDEVAELARELLALRKTDPAGYEVVIAAIVLASQGPVSEPPALTADGATTEGGGNG